MKSFQINSILAAMQLYKLPSDYWLAPDPELEFPEMEKAKLVMQNNNSQSVWDHTMSVVDLLSVKNPVTLLAALFHDLGKISLYPNIRLSETSRFFGHEFTSASIARQRLNEWGTPHCYLDKIDRLILTHMYDVVGNINKKRIREFVARVGPDNIENWFVLRIADSRSYHSHGTYRNKIIEPFREAVMLYMKQQPVAKQPQIAPSDRTIQIEGGDAQ